MTDHENEKSMEERQAQDEADLALGRLVRQMPEEWSLSHEIYFLSPGVKKFWLVYGASSEQKATGDTPEEALRAAGIGTRHGGSQ